MPDGDLEDVKKQVAKEVKLLAQKTEKDCKKAKELCDEQAQLADKKDPSEDDKKRAVDLRKALDDFSKSYATQLDNTNSRINQVLKTKVPKDDRTAADWQKGMAKWYKDLIEKEPGLKIGPDTTVTGDVSIKDKKATLKFNFKFKNP
jgi:vancomycin resistance protein YoaR